MRLILILQVIILMSACDLDSPSENPDQPIPDDKKFFPVTSFLKGQLTELKQASITPLMYTIKEGKKDSAWLSLEETERQLQPFFEPAIDSTNLIPFFEETRFLDQTINAFTFSYMPKSKLPDSISLRRWDIYVNPDNGKVQRIFMITGNAPETRQLTWQSGRKARMITFQDSSGTPIVKEEKEIIWDF